MADQVTVSKLIAFVDQLDDEGRPVFSDEHLRDFIPLIVFTAGGSIDKANANAELKQLMGEFGQRAAVSDGASNEDNLAAIEKYFADHPLPAQLTKGFWDLLREQMLQRQPTGASDAAKKLLGNTGDRALPPTQTGGGGGGALRARLAQMTGDDASKDPGSKKDQK